MSLLFNVTAHESRNVSADADFLCDKAAVRGDMINATISTSKPRGPSWFSHKEKSVLK